MNMSSSAALILMGRLLALFMVLGFLYLIFVSDLFTSMSRRLGGQVFDPDSVRHHVQNSIDPRRIRESLKHFTSYAHIAGTEGDYAQAVDVRSALMKSGLDEVVMDEYLVYLNYPKPGGRAVEILSEDGTKATWSAKIEEEESGFEAKGKQTMVFHGHSKSGDVRGPLIYANYGSREDFKRLEDSGIDTKGAIALVRYYGTQGDRALKVKAAELAGFAGCLIYSDPADDGFLMGSVAPQGRYMPPDGVQRGSVSLMSWVIGDVLTPGWASKKGQPRETTTQTKGLVQIPSIPLSWRDAQKLLQSLEGFGFALPEEWHGGVPQVKWWSGNSSSPIVRLKNEQDEIEQQPIWNIYGKIAGVEQSEKSIIIGNHRDAWNWGAADAGSGTAVMLEVARVFGDLVNRGWRPLRTIEFMSWDAEEYNLIGSTEFVENNLDSLRKNAFAYLNIDTAVTGNEFRASASPVFQSLLHSVLQKVHDPLRNATLRDLWDQRGAKLEGLGAGSDYVAFQDIAGTSSIDITFDGGRFPYHSNYDNFDWMVKVGDPDFVYHTLLAQVLSILILELSNRPVLPFDLEEYSLALGRYLGELFKYGEENGANRDDTTKLDLTVVRDAVTEVEASVAKFVLWEVEWEAAVTGSGGWEPTGLGRQRCEYNSRMATFETNLLDAAYGGGVSRRHTLHPLCFFSHRGPFANRMQIPNRTQFRHVVFGPQLWSGYDEAYFPAIRDAIDARDFPLAQSLANKTAGIIAAAAKALITG
jgi:N-acetylated-alpha-linked acidic dipeptidase